jgi:hypothetical protein
MLMVLGNGSGRAVESSGYAVANPSCVDSVVRATNSMSDNLEAVMRNLTYLENTLGFRDSDRPKTGSAIICVDLTSYDVDHIVGLLDLANKLMDQINSLSYNAYVVDEMLIYFRDGVSSVSTEGPSIVKGTSRKNLCIVPVIRMVTRMSETLDSIINELTHLENTLGLRDSELETAEDTVIVCGGKPDAASVIKLGGASARVMNGINDLSSNINIVSKLKRYMGYCESRCLSED